MVWFCVTVLNKSQELIRKWGWQTMVRIEMDYNMDKFETWRGTLSNWLRDLYEILQNLKIYLEMGSTDNKLIPKNSARFFLFYYSPTAAKYFSCSADADEEMAWLATLCPPTFLVCLMIDPIVLLSMPPALSSAALLRWCLHTATGNLPWRWFLAILRMLSSEILCGTTTTEG